jgi:thioredoxin-related protein
MKHPKIFIGLIASLILILAVLFWCMAHVLKTKKTAEENTKQFFINGLVTIPDSISLNKYDLTIGEPVIMFFFSTDCDFCHKQLDEITNAIDSFEETNILLVSDENISSIGNYAALNKLEEYRNVTIAKINKGEIIRKYNITTAPTLLIYDKNNQLVKRFVGNTPVDSLLYYTQSVVIND